MSVIGTAGHVDHGKSELVKALTGIDPDRLVEEKVRGMTIDLGFAWLKLPSGREVSIVDVPGHERLVRNMLAGAGGIDLALLVVAADEGVMPQTREHLAILDMLQVKGGVLVVTKKDLVDQDWLALVAAEVQELVVDTALSQAPLVAVSSLTGEGLPELLATIDQLLEVTPQRRDLGRPRLPIDRVFTVAGFGTVVTGTLIDGQLRLGQEVEVLPAGFRARIRGLQTHKQKIEVATPGSRVAVNLALLTKDEPGRGDVVTTPGWLRPTIALDARLRAVSYLPRPLAHNRRLTFHLGSGEVTGKLRLLDRDRLDPGAEGWVQLHLDRPVAAVKGDLFILRSAWGTVAGGAVVETHARRHRRYHAATLERLVALERGSPADVFVGALEAGQPAELQAVASRLGMSVAQATELVSQLVTERRLVASGSLLFSAAGWSALVDRALREVQAHHERYPLRLGVAREELRSRLRLPAQAFADAVDRMVGDGVLEEKQARLCLPGRRPQPSPAQRAAADSFLAALARSPYSPPIDTMPEAELFNMLVEDDRVVKVSQDVAFSTEAYNEMVNRIVQHIKDKGEITVAQVRDMFGTSRKYALALMEHLDSQRVTRRVGDVRLLR